MTGASDQAAIATPAVAAPTVGRTLLRTIGVTEVIALDAGSAACLTCIQYNLCQNQAMTIIIYHFVYL